MQGIFQKENTDKALKYGIYRHLPTYEKIIRNLVSFYNKKLLNKMSNSFFYIKDEDYKIIREKVTEEKLKEYFKDIVHGKITRYEIPSISALNFVLEDALGGGVTRSLAIDMHGKTLGSALLEMRID